MDLRQSVQVPRLSPFGNEEIIIIKRKQQRLAYFTEFHKSVVNVTIYSPEAKQRV